MMMIIIKTATRKTIDDLHTGIPAAKTRITLNLSRPTQKAMIHWKRP